MVGVSVELGAAGSVDHELFDGIEEDGTVGGELAGEKAVNIIWSAQLGVVVAIEDSVHVGERALLELYDKDVTDNLSKDSSLYILDELPALGLKHANDEIRTLSGILTWVEGILDLGPVGVGSHGKEEVTTFKAAIDGQGVLELLLHVASAACKAGRQDEPLTKSVEVGVDVSSDGVCESRIQLGA